MLSLITTLTLVISPHINRLARIQVVAGTTWEDLILTALVIPLILRIT